MQTTGRGRDAQAIIRRDRPVAVVMDIGLPDIDGLSVCQQLRAEGDWTPILFVTARDEDVDRILGLELGGDDYLVKPFNPRELVARVRTVLRRAGAAAVGGSPVLVAGRLRADTAQRRVWVDAREIALTATEFDLLIHLMKHPRAGLRPAEPAQFGVGIRGRVRAAHGRRAHRRAAIQTR